jgi:hypothetical protein
MDGEELQIRYWDVYPKSIKVTHSWESLSIPLSIRGNPRGEIQYEVVGDTIVWIDGQGRVRLGERTGATMIMVYDTAMRDSVRYVQVEVLEESGGGYMAY